MGKFHVGVRSAALCAVALGVLAPASAQITYKSIPLDAGGWFSGFAMHSSGRLYGYGDVFGAWRSDNAGQTWTDLNRNITTFDSFVSGIAVAGNPDLVAFRSPKRLWRSDNGGASWTEALSGLANVELFRGASSVMFYPGKTNELWVATNRTGLQGSLWRSVNNGSWEKMGGTNFDNNKAVTIYVHPSFPNQVWVGTKGGLFISTDSGATWTHAWGNGVTNTVNGVTAPVVVKHVMRKTDGTGYIVTNNGGYQVTASDWNNLSTYSYNFTVSAYGGWGPDGAAVVKNSSGQEIFISSRQETRIWSATAAPNTWQTYAMSFSTPPLPIWGVPSAPGAKPSTTDQIVQDPNSPNRWFMTNGKSPLISTDYGANWTYVPNGGGIASVVTQKVNFPRGNSSMALIPGADKGAFVVTDGGSSGNAWGASNPSIGKLMTAHEIMSSNNGSILIAAGTNQSANSSMIVKSTNYGATGSWTELNLTNSGLPANGEGITRSAMNPNDPNDFLVLLGYGTSPQTPGLYRTFNGGASFSKITSIPDGLHTGSRNHSEHGFLEVGGGTATNYRYLASRGKTSTGADTGYFYRSTDHGATWNPAPHPFPNSNGTNGWIFGFAADRATAGKLWATNSMGVKFSNDHGSTWSSSIPGFIEATKIDAAHGRVAVWGRRTGDTWNKIYYSSDNGANWIEATGVGHRYSFVINGGIAVDPNVAGKIWVSGVSGNVISNIPATGTPPPTNLISNPSFDAENYDTQTPSGWSEWEGDANYNSIAATSSYTESYGGSNSGARHGTHWKGNAAYRVYTYQVKTGLTNGLYTLRAYAKRGGNQTNCHMEAADFGSTTRTVNIPASSAYQLIEIKDINVTNGQCKIGFWTVAGAGDWSYFDDVSFFKQ